MIGGDFNIIRGPGEKNNNYYNDRWPFLFNAIIDAFNLRELDSSGRQFTWANNLPNQTFEKLDRILICTELEDKYPHMSVISDHTPLLLGTGQRLTTCHYQFKFELGWLLRDGFKEMICDIWQSVQQGSNPLETWQKKRRRLRQFLKGWAKNTSGTYKKEKQQLLDKLDVLDKKAEKQNLE
jgi:hypothetical protein